MKTVTEFSGLQFLKNAYKQLKEIKAAGKTPEELIAAMGESLKLEGEKLTHVLNALEAVQDKVEGLKRVLVVTLAEGEKAPVGAFQKEAFHYISEFFPSLKPKNEGRGRGPGQDRGKGGKRDKKKRGPRRGDGKGRSFGPGGSPSGQNDKGSGTGAAEGKDGERRRPRFRPRGRGGRPGTSGAPGSSGTGGSHPATGPQQLAKPRESSEKSSSTPSQGVVIKPVIKPVNHQAGKPVTKQAVNPELVAIRKEALEAAKKTESSPEGSGESSGGQ